MRGQAVTLIPAQNGFGCRLEVMKKRRGYWGLTHRLKSCCLASGARRADSEMQNVGDAEASGNGTP